jgi:hypothetical protein
LPKTSSLPFSKVPDLEKVVFQGEIQKKNPEVLGMNLPGGLSYLELSVKAENVDPSTAPSFPILAELDGIEISEIDLNPGTSNQTGKH